jgi:hypothetical protein
MQIDSVTQESLATHKSLGTELLQFAAITAIILIALVVRLHYLNQPMRYDEAYSYNAFASRPLSYGLSHYPRPNNHLLNTLFMHFSTSVFGSSPWAIRLPAFVAGVLLIPATYWSVKRIWGRNVGLLASALVASSEKLIEFSTNARGYTFVALAAMVALGAAAKFERSSLARILFVVAGVIGLYAIPVMVFPLGAVALWAAGNAIVHERGQARIRLLLTIIGCTVVSVLVAAALYAPVVVTEGWYALVKNDFVASKGFGTVMTGLVGFGESVWRHWTSGLTWWISIPILTGFVLGLVFTRRLEKKDFPLAGACVLWTLIALMAQRVLPFPRVLLGLLPLALATTAAGWSFAIGADSRRTAVVSVAVSVVLITVVVHSGRVVKSTETGAFRDADSVAAVLVRCLTKQSYLYVRTPSYEPLRYYMNRRGAMLERFRQRQDVRQIYFIDNHDAPTSFKETVQSLPIELGNIGPRTPELVATFEHSSLYVLRKDPGGSCRATA